MKNLQWIIAFTIALFFNNNIYGQGWEKTFGGTFTDSATCVKQTIDGGYIVSGSIQPTSNVAASEMHLIKTDVNGSTLWAKNYGGLNADAGNSVEQTTDGGYIVAGWTKSFGAGAEDFYLVKTNPYGDTLWTKTYGGAASEKANCVQQTTDGGYILVGSTSSFGASFINAYLVKTDANGDSLWTKTYGTVGLNLGNFVQQTSDGGYIIAGSNSGSMLKVDANGTVLWTKNHTPSGLVGELKSVEQTTDGGYILCGWLTSSNYDIFLIKTDANGDTTWTETYGSNDGEFGAFAQQTTDGGYIITGLSYASGSASNLYIIKTDPSGVTQWTKNHGGTSFDAAKFIQQTSDGGYIVAGMTRSYGAGNLDFYLIKTNSLGETYANHIQGNIFQDNNTDCTNNSGDINLQGIIVKAKKTGAAPFFSTTDAQGNYDISVDLGTYIVTVISPLHYYNFTCQVNSSTVVFSTFNQQQTIDFPLEASTLCPLLQVDISAPIMRTVNSYYTISYCNNGTIDASNAMVDVTFDPNLTILNTSIPVVSQTGNIYTFNLGTVAIGQCDLFSATVQVNPTTTIQGQTICSEVSIHPDSLCISNLWNGPIMDVTGACINDTVHFLIENIGGPMGTPLNYFVYEDNVMFRTGSTNILGTGGTQPILEAASSGKTYRLIVNQPIGIPPLVADSTATAAVEGCKPLPDGSFNTGFITNFSNGYSSPFRAIDCQPNVGSFDPNDKSAQPAGYNSNHYIYSYTALDYKVRYQNTGTDTAFRVVVRDTLSAYLDLSTLVMGASSNPYTWRIYDNGILEVTFDPIALPDSNINEPASHGFFRFRINQKANNPSGTIIYNQAAIYFDYNAPVLTNTTFHTIGDSFETVMLLVVDDILEEEQINVNIFPNPFTHSTTIQIQGKDYEELQLSVFDLTGREVRQEQGHYNNQIQLKKGNLQPGVYIYQLEGDGQLINTGKIIVR